MKFTSGVRGKRIQGTLPRQVALQIEAAEGWLMLGDSAAAVDELEKVSGEFYYHPRVLAVRWEIYAAAKWWEAAWIVSTALCEVAPDIPAGWISQANALREYKGLRSAKKLLLSVVARFPSDPVIPYNIACFACQLGQMPDACKWLLRAFDIEKTAQLKLMALCDPDLKPLWEKIADGLAASLSSSESEED